MFVGKINVNYFNELDTLKSVSLVSPGCINCYAFGLDDGEIGFVSEEELNNNIFYTGKLGWCDDIWDLSDISFQNGEFIGNHYPKIKERD